MSKVIANTYRHSGASTDAITLDSSGNATFPGNLTVTGSVTGDNNTVYDDTNLRKDLTTLALQTAVDTNRKAYNLNNSFIDQFEDSTGIGSTTTATRDAAEFVHSLALASDDTGGTLTELSSVAGGHFSVDTGSHPGKGTKFESGADREHTWKAATDSDNPLTGTYWVRFRPYHSWSNNDNGHPGWQIAIDRNDAASWNYGSDFYTMNDGEHFWMGSQGTNTASTNTHYFFRDNAEYSSSSKQEAWASGEDYYFVRTVSGSTGTLKVYKGDYWDDDNLLYTYGDYSGTQGDSFGAGIGGPGNENTPDNTFTHANIAYKTGITALKAQTTSATGTVIGVANTASSSRTKVSGVLLYKNASGTATIGTDLKIYFTCNGGTNWTEAASYTAGSDFSTGIKTIYLGETTCTAGTDVRYKAEWANQAAGSKVTQLHGIGVNY